MTMILMMNSQHNFELSYQNPNNFLRAMKGEEGENVKFVRRGSGLFSHDSSRHPS